MKILNTLLIIYFFCTLVRADKVNILLVQIDDEKLEHLGYTECVPNIQKLKSKAISLSNFYSPSPRYINVELLSGKYYVNIKDVAMGNDMQASEPCVAKDLKEQGVATAYIGKWIDTQSLEYSPTMLGFDLFYGIFDSDYSWPHDWQLKAIKAGKKKAKEIKEASLSLILNNNIIKIPAKPKDFLVDFTSETLRFINSSYEQGKPFFIYLNYASSYVSEVALDKFTSDKSGIKEYYQKLDSNFSKILKDLERKEILDDTMIVFISKSAMKALDNSTKNPENLAPESQHKYASFIYMPKLFKEPKSLNGVVCSLDMPAFILDVAKASDGKNSMLGYFLGNKPCDKSPILYYGAYREIFAMRDNNFKILLEKDKRDIKLQLYDLDKDPLEKNNLAETMSEKALDLKKKAKYLDYKQPKILTKSELEKREKYEKAKAKELEKMKAKADKVKNKDSKKQDKKSK